MQVDAKWCIVFEEDAIAAHGFLRSFNALMNSKRARARSVALVKLYAPDRWDGFNSDDAPALVLVCALAAAATAATTLVLTPARAGRRAQGTRAAIAAVAVAIGVLANLELAGKQALRAAVAPRGHRLRPLAKNHAAGTAAIAYPRAATRRVLEFLQFRDLSSCEPVDVLLGVELPAALPAVAVLEAAPSLVQHIGAYSSGYRNDGDVRRLTQDSRFWRARPWPPQPRSF